jgi:hypothetical protein
MLLTIQPNNHTHIHLHTQARTHIYTHKHAHTHTPLYSYSCSFCKPSKGALPDPPPPIFWPRVLTSGSARPRNCIWSVFPQAYWPYCAPRSCFCKWDQCCRRCTDRAVPPDLVSASDSSKHHIHWTNSDKKCCLGKDTNNASGLFKYINHIIKIICGFWLYCAPRSRFCKWGRETPNPLTKQFYAVKQRVY